MRYKTIKSLRKSNVSETDDFPSGPELFFLSLFFAQVGKAFLFERKSATGCLVFVPFIRALELPRRRLWLENSIGRLVEPRVGRNLETMAFS